MAHEKAVYDISFSLEETVFATVSEDASLRLFDTRELRNSNIVYEMENKQGLTHVKWNLQNRNLMAVVAQDDNNVLLFDKRRPNQIVDTLNRRSKVNAISWSPAASNLICSVHEDGNALIWDLNDSGQPIVDEQAGAENQERSMEPREPKSEYTTGQKIFNVVWSQADPTWVSISFDERLQTLRT